MSKQKRKLRLYPFDIMSPGDSFYISSEEMPKDIYAALSRKARHGGYELKISKDSKGGVRVWLTGYKPWRKNNFKVEKGIPIPHGKFKPVLNEIKLIECASLLKNGTNEVRYTGDVSISHLRSVVRSYRDELGVNIGVYNRNGSIWLVKKENGFFKMLPNPNTVTLLAEGTISISGTPIGLKRNRALIHAAANSRGLKVKTKIKNGVLTAWLLNKGNNG